MGNTLGTLAATQRNPPYHEVCHRNPARKRLFNRDELSEDNRNGMESRVHWKRMTNQDPTNMKTIMERFGGELPPTDPIWAEQRKMAVKAVEDKRVSDFNLETEKLIKTPHPSMSRKENNKMIKSICKRTAEKKMKLLEDRDESRRQAREDSMTESNFDVMDQTGFEGDLMEAAEEVGAEATTVSGSEERPAKRPKTRPSMREMAKELDTTRIRGFKKQAAATSIAEKNRGEVIDTAAELAEIMGRDYTRAADNQLATIYNELVTDANANGLRGLVDSKVTWDFMKERMDELRKRIDKALEEEGAK